MKSVYNNRKLLGTFASFDDAMAFVVQEQQFDAAFRDRQPKSADWLTSLVYYIV